MRTSQKQWNPASGWQNWASPARKGAEASSAAQWILLFGSGTALANAAPLAQLRQHYPHALITGCSTAGEILDEQVFDDSLIATIVEFTHTQVRLATASVGADQDSYEVGKRLANSLRGPDLRHVMVLSDGLAVNGTALAQGLNAQLPEWIAVTGGMAADGGRFQQTLVCADNAAAERQVAAIGFYGQGLHVGYGSLGGWDSFGPERLITRSQGNVLYELDGHSALALYKQYLGEHAADLPSAGLLFPLTLRSESGDGLVRTVLSVDEEAGSMTFAGDMPQGTHARLMKANFNRLIDGAAGAARSGLLRLGSFTPELAVLISCVGRKLVLKQRVEEEVESVREVLGADTAMTGFYSYGEICPNGIVPRCELHNQTMTITTFAEVAPNIS